MNLLTISYEAMSITTVIATIVILLIAFCGVLILARKRFELPAGDYVIIMPTHSAMETIRFHLTDIEGIKRACDKYPKGRFMVTRGNKAQFERFKPVCEIENYL